MKQSLTRAANLATLFMFFLYFFLMRPPEKNKISPETTANDTASFHNNKRNVDYKVQPKDNLYIHVFALDEKAFSFSNKQSGNATAAYNDYANDASIYLNSYSVSADGNIDFPIVGKVYVRDLTVERSKPS